MMSEPIDRELLVKYMQGKCDAQETELVRFFLLQPKWQQALDELLEDDFNQFDPAPPADALSREWSNRFRQKNFNKPVRRLQPMRWISYAAACIILMAAGIYLANFAGRHLVSRQPIALMEKANPRGQRSKITLSDSSVVYLGAESKIVFPEKFEPGSREISLTGEAFFEITKNPNRPFIIHTGDVQTRVLGTSFKINAFKGQPLKVAVATGKVRVDKQVKGSNILKSLAVLIPGQEVNYNSANQTAKVNEVDIESMRAWKNGTTNFIATSLRDIADDLERQYNVKIDFKDSGIQNYHLSLIIKNTDALTHSLDIICNTTHLHYHTTGNRITITKKGGK